MSSEILVRSKAGGQEPDQHAWASGISYLSKYIGWFLGALILVSLVLCYAAYRAGSFSRALPYLAGQRFFVVESEINLGEVACGADVDSVIRLLNRGSVPVNIVGARKSCGCILLGSFPMEVPAGADSAIEFRMHAPEGPGVFSHTIVLFVADQGVSSTQITLTGSVINE